MLPHQLLGRGGGVRERHLPEALPAQVRDVEAVPRHGDPAGARLGRLPVLDGVDELLAPHGALDLGPAVVAPGLNDVELVPGLLSELRGVHRPGVVPGDALGIAVPQGVDQRPGEGVVRRDLPVGGHPEDLARQGLGVLRAAGIGGVPGRRVQHPVGAEGQAAAVVVVRGGDAVQDRLGRPEGEGTRVPGDRQAHDPVVGVGGVVGVEERVVHGEPQQSRLAPGREPLDATGFAGAAAVEHLGDPAAVPLADQGGRVVEGDRPGSLEAGGDDGGLAEGRGLGDLGDAVGGTGGLRAPRAAHQGEREDGGSCQDPAPSCDVSRACGRSGAAGILCGGRASGHGGRGHGGLSGADAARGRRRTVLGWSSRGAGPHPGVLRTNYPAPLGVEPEPRRCYHPQPWTAVALIAS